MSSLPLLPSALSEGQAAKCHPWHAVIATMAFMATYTLLYQGTSQQYQYIPTSVAASRLPGVLKVSSTTTSSTSGVQNWKHWQASSLPSSVASHPHLLAAQSHVDGIVSHGHFWGWGWTAMVSLVAAAVVLLKTSFTMHISRQPSSLSLASFSGDAQRSSADDTAKAAEQQPIASSPVDFGPLPDFVKKICIVGGGNASQALAALLPAAGIPVNMWANHKDHADRINAGLDAEGGIRATFTDGRTVVGRPDKVSKDPAEVVPECNVLLIPLPSFTYASIFAELAPHLRPGMYIGITPGQGGFDWAARQALGDAGMEGLTFFSLFPMPVTCLVREFGRAVDIQVVKRKFRLGANPATATAECCTLMSALFRAVVEPLPHLLAATLYPINPVIHPARMFGISLRWRPNCPLQYNPLFYEEMDEASAGLMDCLNAEVQMIGAAIAEQSGVDLQLPHVCDFLGWVYAADHPDMSSTGAFFRSIPAYRVVRAPLLPVPGGLAPDFKDRYFTEDIPFGLCVYKGIADIVGCETPVIDMIVGWAQHHMGKEYIVDAKLKGRDIGETNAPQRFGLTSLPQLLGIPSS